MGYKFDEHGFMIIPDPREFRIEREIGETLKNKVVIVRHAYCPNGHDVIWKYVKFNRHSGLRIHVRRTDGQEGDVVTSPIFGDHTRMCIGVDLVPGEKLEFQCPICGVKIPVLNKCDQCEDGEMRVLSYNPNYDISHGVAICDVVDCPSSYIVSAGELIAHAQVHSDLNFAGL